jgi:beta-galactosidase GanA
VAWEQIEARQGKFDFSFVDTLLGQAREHRVRLILLWFGTWKNTSQLHPRVGETRYCTLPANNQHQGRRAPFRAWSASGRSNWMDPQLKDIDTDTSALVYGALVASRM